MWKNFRKSRKGAKPQSVKLIPQITIVTLSEVEGLWQQNNPAKNTKFLLSMFVISTKEKFSQVARKRLDSHCGVTSTVFSNI
ncbi:hypothetical protein D0817_01815 [Flavobacterium cupreum]|uniref:Uncharacterized protein n=1 Tax=Flavobacterium cupreum TaxID=2133766 RepID=A0A434ADC5_9FLAO|nr:hypothetical protein D0817_01815 [Flavobacterium cupreum]